MNERGCRRASFVKKVGGGKELEVRIDLAQRKGINFIRRAAFDSEWMEKGEGIECLSVPLSRRHY